MRSRPDLDRPDLQIIFMPAHRNANGHWLPRGHGYGIIFVNLRPASRGSVTLTARTRTTSQQSISTSSLYPATSMCWYGVSRWRVRS